MFKRPHYIALGLVAAVLLTLMSLPDRATARLKLSIGSLFLPLFGLANSTHQLAGKAADALTPKRELLRQNEELRQENLKLKLQAQQDRVFEQENDRLRKLFGWEQQQRWKLKLARVVLREPANWWRTVQIDLGSRDEVRLNMAVLSIDGALVGRIESVGLTRSRVVLLGDPNCKVFARVENDARDTGVVGASGPLESEFVEMSYLSKNAILKAGQNVKTSGEGGVFPPDILVGKILDSRSAEYGLVTTARIKLAANLNGLEEVWVRLK